MIKLFHTFKPSGGCMVNRLPFSITLLTEDDAAIRVQHQTFYAGSKIKCDCLNREKSPMYLWIQLQDVRKAAEPLGNPQLVESDDRYSTQLLINNDRGRLLFYWSKNPTPPEEPCLAYVWENNNADTVVPTRTT